MFKRNNSHVQRHARPVIACCLVVALATGCQQQSAADGAGMAGAAAPPQATHVVQHKPPLVIEQCGRPYRYETVPQRVVAHDSGIAAMLLFLGLRDRLVGYSGIGPHAGVNATIRAMLEPIANLSSTNMNLEAMLGAHADFVVGGWSYGFHKGAVTPALLADYGIDSYVITESCVRVHERERVSLHDTLQDLRNLARIFAIESTVDARIEQLAQALERLKRKTSQVERRPRVFVYDSGTKLPLTAGGFATPQAIIRAAGGRNIFADIDSSWVTASWEAVIKRNPEWIVIIDYGVPDAQGKIEFLLNKDVLNNVEAIRKHQFLVMPYAEATPSPYNVMQAQRLAAALHPQLDITAQDPMALLPGWDGASP